MWCDPRVVASQLQPWAEICKRLRRSITLIPLPSTYAHTFALDLRSYLCPRLTLTPLPSTYTHTFALDLRSHLCPRLTLTSPHRARHSTPTLTHIGLPCRPLETAFRKSPFVTTPMMISAVKYWPA